MLGVSHVVEVLLLGLRWWCKIPGQLGTTRCTNTQKEHTHAWQRRHNTTASPRLRRGAGRCCCRAAATAAAAAAAAVLLLCCCCAAAASRPSMHRGAQPVSTDCFSFVFFGTHAGASNGTAAAAAAAVVATAAAAAATTAAAQQLQQVQQQGRPKHMYEYTPRHQAG